MEERHSGLTKAIASSYTEAARVCLDRHHRSPIELELTTSSSTFSVTAEWEKTDSRTSAAWANDIDATEAGAYACALAAVEISEGFVAIHRAETRTGADYYVAPAGATVLDLEDCLRFEVSGIGGGSEATVRQRLEAKLRQAARGDSNLPAIAGVVGFGARLIMLAPLEE